MNLKKSFIKGTGFYVPKKILTNHDLEKMVETSDEWITTRTGIKERRIAGDDETTASMGVEAAKMAIEDAGIKPEDIDVIITNTITPDMLMPNTSALIADKLNIKNIGVFDIEAACSGFLYGLSIANQFIKTGEYKNILVISSETLSRVTDWTDRNTCVLFGDGAAAVVVSISDNDSEILATHLGGDGAYKDLLYIPAGGSLLPASNETVNNHKHFVKMSGNEVFKIAINQMVDAAKKVLAKANVSQEDVSLLIPHQANIRIIKMVQRHLSLSDDKVFVNLQKYGNTSAATIPIALAEAVREGRLKRGDLLLMVAFGGGFTWASALVRF